MRILGVSYRVINQGAAYRADMEDSGKGWKLLQTAPHSDRVECALIREWWHTEEASTEDNVNKQPVHVFHGFDDKARYSYILHTASHYSIVMCAGAARDHFLNRLPVQRVAPALRAAFGPDPGSVHR